MGQMFGNLVTAMEQRADILGDLMVSPLIRTRVRSRLRINDQWATPSDGIAVIALSSEAFLKQRPSPHRSTKGAFARMRRSHRQAPARCYSFPASVRNTSVDQTEGHY